MTFGQGAGLLAAAIALLSVLTVLRGAHRPLGSAVLSAGAGIAALAAVNFFGAYTGVTLAVNWATAFAAVVLGVPGVIGTLLLRLLLCL